MELLKPSWVLAEESCHRGRYQLGVLSRRSRDKYSQLSKVASTPSKSQPDSEARNLPRSSDHGEQWNGKSNWQLPIAVWGRCLWPVKILNESSKWALGPHRYQKRVEPFKFMQRMRRIRHC